METGFREDEFSSLPEEILLNIFRFVDNSRFNIGLVCKKFYELLLELERDSHPLVLSYTEVINAFENPPAIIQL